MKIRNFFLHAIALAGVVWVPLSGAEPIRVMIWDEQQAEQKQAYGGLFLGEALAAQWKNEAGLVVKLANPGDPEQGLSDADLDETDVLVIWCHRKIKEQDEARAEAVVKRVIDGKLQVIALHSAHWAKAFVRLMQERAKMDALLQIPEAERAGVKWKFLNENPIYQMLPKDAALTPSLQKVGDLYQLTLPHCVFPSWRADGAPSHVTTLLPAHPIAKGLPATWDIPQSEMYGEPFHVPAPDEVVFEEKWDKGEHFRSGCVWKVGKGRVFYFRPGHETYPIFIQKEPVLVLTNAIRWMGAKPTAVAKQLPLPGEVFLVDERNAFLIPSAKDSGGKPKPWVWYAPTLPNLPGHEENWMFQKFLEAGIAIAGIDVGESYGSPDGRKLFSSFHQEMTNVRGYSSKPVLLGRSRGGLMTLSWAAENPTKTAGFAGIYPVCNVASYPGVDKAAGAYHLTPQEFKARLSEHNPIDRLADLAKAQVPLFAIHGDSDAVVPLNDNSALMKERYVKAGGTMELVIPPGQGHNMWAGFFQSEELVKFVIARAKVLE